jgi:hypothetical protein
MVHHCHWQHDGDMPVIRKTRHNRHSSQPNCNGRFEPECAQVMTTTYLLQKMAVHTKSGPHVTGFMAPRKHGDNQNRRPESCGAQLLTLLHNVHVPHVQRVGYNASLHHL